MLISQKSPSKLREIAIVQQSKIRSSRRHRSYWAIHLSQASCVRNKRQESWLRILVRAPSRNAVDLAKKKSRMQTSSRWAKKHLSASETLSYTTASLACPTLQTKAVKATPSRSWDFSYLLALTITNSLPAATSPTRISTWHAQATTLLSSSSMMMMLGVWDYIKKTRNQARESSRLHASRWKKSTSYDNNHSQISLWKPKHAPTLLVKKSLLPAHSRRYTLELQEAGA